MRPDAAEAACYAIMNSIVALLEKQKISITSIPFHVRSELVGFPPLSLESIFDSPPAPPGSVAQLSIAHYQEWIGSDQIANPEVTFAVYVNLEFPGLEPLGIVVSDSTQAAWLFIPTSLRMDGDYWESFSGPSHSLLANRTLLRAMCSFCREWDQIIKNQGFLYAHRNENS